MTFFTAKVKTILKFVWDHERALTDKAVLKRRAKLGASHFLFQNILQNCSNQSNMIHIRTDTWTNVTEWRSPETRSLLYGQLTYDKGESATGEKIVSSVNWKFIRKRMKLDLCPTPFTKINTKWIQGLNIRPETVKLLEENIGEKSSWHGSWQQFVG